MTGGTSRWLGRAGWVAALAAGLVLMAALGWGLAHPARGGTASVLGRQAPDVSVRAPDGSTVGLAELRGRPVVLNFWASWCSPCRLESAALKEAARARAGRVAFLGVDIEDQPGAASAYLAWAGLPYPAGPAVGGIPPAYGVDAPPQTFFIDARGVVAARFVGPLDGVAIDRYLQLAGAP
jgi:cytochrome c biogenesis protein CcmG/thiol:disulfide interchange protein DsbE